MPKDPKQPCKHLNLPNWPILLPSVFKKGSLGFNLLLRMHNFSNFTSCYHFAWFKEKTFGISANYLFKYVRQSCFGRGVLSWIICPYISSNFVAFARLHIDYVVINAKNTYFRGLNTYLESSAKLWQWLYLTQLNDNRELLIIYGTT